MSNRKITILGGGQAGLQLACGLLQKGYEVKLVQNRTADEIRTGRVMSSQCMFDAALQNERDVGLDFWAQGVPDRRFRQFRRAGSGWLRQQGHRLERHARSAGPERRPAHQISGVDAGIRAPRRHTGDQGGDGPRPGRLCGSFGPDHRRGRQGRHCQAVRARRRKIAVRQAAARAGPHLPPRHDAAARPFGRQFQPHPDGRRIFRLSGADQQRRLRHHGVRGHTRRPDGLLEGRRQPAAASRAIEMDPRHVPAVGGRALPQRRADRCQRHPRRRLCADRAQACRPAALRQGGARTGGCRLPQRPDHRARLEQRLQGARRSTWMRSSRMAIAASTRRSCRRRSTHIGTMRSM